MSLIFFIGISVIIMIMLWVWVDIDKKDYINEQEYQEYQEYLNWFYSLPPQERERMRQKARMELQTMDQRERMLEKSSFIKFYGGEVWDDRWDD